MHKHYFEHLKATRVIGACKMPSAHRMKLKFGDYIDLSQLPPTPASVDYSGPAMSVISNIEGNSNWGDCVLAEEAHFIGVMTGNAGTLYSYTEAQTLAAYSALTGFDPTKPETDQGTDPTVCLNYFCKNPYADGSINAGFAEVDMSNQAEVQFAIWAFGNLKLWLCLPDAYTNVSANGFLWDVGTSNPANGHCVGSPSYTPVGPGIETWGLLGAQTWAAAAALETGSGGAAVRITPDWLIKANGKTPSGFAYQDLVSDFNKFFGGNIPVPGPSPLPPGPIPLVPPTYAQARAAFAAQIAPGLPLLTHASVQAAYDSSQSPLWPSS